jgi:hypothetical protein
MKRFFFCVCILSVLAGCSGGSDPVECWLVAPEADAVVSETATVRIGYSGPADRFELLVNGEVVAETQETGTEGIVEILWNTTERADGEITAVTRVYGDGVDGESEPITLIVDNAAPIASLDLERLSVIDGEFAVPVTITEANLVSARLMSNDVELANITETAGEIPWDTTAVESRLYWVRLVVEDAAGRTAETETIPVVVANNGRRLTPVDEYQYIPGTWVTSVEDTRVSAEMDIPGTEPENIVRVVSWVTWDASTAWTVEFSLGQGFCPHRGIMYVNEISDTGEIVLDMAWTEVDPELQAAAMALDTDHPDGAEAFPFNGDPATCGSFFGHVRPMETTSSDIDIEINFVFIYGES